MAVAKIRRHKNAYGYIIIDELWEYFNPKAKEIKRMHNLYRRRNR